MMQDYLQLLIVIMVLAVPILFVVFIQGVFRGKLQWVLFSSGIYLFFVAVIFISAIALT